ncbi:MAG: homoserine O-acetyltransferase [Deltaproteobacteria bacterium]|uniref:homoserine O-acetyltransferase MetX n=1 Tax=Desulfobacula sp. TaxID=2593537 RepID=UPI0019AA4FAD|nr:homoserine O-acetyltransferase [Candidatus Desulfobacula maris]MBL6994409.1 homoserine O-acetyltransferase [Desulfobacula sp.]
MSEYIEQNQTGVSVGIVEKQFFTFAMPPDKLKLESKTSIGPVTIAYETCGTLNPEKSNVILVLHALSGDSHMAGYYDPKDAKPGWWDIMVGPGKGIDTDKYFVICSNIIGSCAGSTGPSSIDPETNKEYGTLFPHITIGDMVEAQKALIDHLKINSILSLIGGSIGGMQVLEWCVRYPDMINSAIPLATTTRHSALAIAFNEVARQAIMADPNWNQGHYYSDKKPDMGLAIARMIGHITYLSDESMRLKFGRKLQNRSALSFEFGAEFQVESYLQHQGNKFIERFDANSFLYITKAADYFDLAGQYGSGSLVKAFSKCKSKFLVVSYTSDWLYPTYQSKEMVKAMKKNDLDVSFCEIDAQWGHDAFLLPSDRLDDLIRGFLRSASNET